MTTRAQLVQRMAGAMAAEADEVDFNDWAAFAIAAIDAVLPQVHTVAELEALPGKAVLVNDLGDAFVWPSRIRSDVLLDYGPLTVVWQSEVTA